MEAAKKNLLNEGAVKSILDSIVRQNRLMEAPGILMSIVGQELQQLCAAYAQPLSNAGQSPLARYAHLHPNGEQIRHALDRLLLLPAQKGTRHYRFFSPRQWLCVFKVLNFLGILHDGYGCMAHMQVYVAHLYEGLEAPRVPCRQDDLTKKNISRPFSFDLKGWEQNRESHDMCDYWSLALSFLQFLADECVTECVTSQAVTEVTIKHNQL